MKEIKNIVWFLIHRCHKLITLFLLYKRNAITLFTAKQTSCHSHKKDISAVLSLFRPPSCNSALNHFQHVNVHLLWSDEIRSIKEIMSHILLIGNVQFGKSRCINAALELRIKWQNVSNCKSAFSLNRCILNCIIIMANTNTLLIQ